MTAKDRWAEVWYDGEDRRWHWRTVVGRGNLPDVVVKGTSKGYAFRRGAVRAAIRENSDIVDVRYVTPRVP
jgi:hypothetical protein